MKIYRTLISAAFILFISVTITLPVLAADPPSPTPDFIGDVELPSFWLRWTSAPGGDVAGGPIVLIINSVFRLILIGAGMFSVWKVIQAGFTFITSSGDSQALNSARDNLVWTLIGLLVIAGSFVLIAIIGIIFFGDAMMFIKPTITGAP